jgi:hypothetical protein
VNVPYLAAGVLGLLGALIHGGVGEVTVIRRLSLDSLPATRWGGPETTLGLIRGTWHLLTTAFLALGTGLTLCGQAGPGATCRGVGMLATGTFGAFAVLVVAGALLRPPRSLIRHPAPLLMTAATALAWWGTTL